MNSPTAETSRNATHAGGHTGPHVYLVYWPEHRILKVGISQHARWQAWRRLDAVELATLDVCCHEWAATIERRALDILELRARRAFEYREQAVDILGPRAVGWTECYEMPNATPTADPYDFHAWYDLALPTALTALLDRHNAAWAPIDHEVLNRVIARLEARAAFSPVDASPGADNPSSAVEAS